jgi:hypothetical protein
MWVLLLMVVVVVVGVVVEVVVLVVGPGRKMNPCPYQDVHHAYCQ